MSNYIIDSHCWIDYFLGNNAGAHVKELLESTTHQCFTSSLSVSEVTAKLKKLELDYDLAYVSMRQLSQILVVDGSVAFEAGKLYIEKRKKHKDIGIVDVLIMAQAKEHNLTIVTGDHEHFKDEKNTVFIGVK